MVSNLRNIEIDLNIVISDIESGDITRIDLDKKLRDIRELIRYEDESIKSAIQNS